MNPTSENKLVAVYLPVLWIMIDGPWLGTQEFFFLLFVILLMLLVLVCWRCYVRCVIVVFVGSALCMPYEWQFSPKICTHAPWAVIFALHRMHMKHTNVNVVLMLLLFLMCFYFCVIFLCLVFTRTHTTHTHTPYLTNPGKIHTHTNTIAVAESIPLDVCSCLHKSVSLTFDPKHSILYSIENKKCLRIYVMINM